MSHPTITLDAAHQILARGRAKAAALDLHAVFTVLDAGANLVAFERMDGAWLASNDLAVTKARTAVMFEAPSETLNAPLQLDQPPAHFDHTNGGLLLMGGGLPVFDDAGHLIGGVGASGGTPDQDADMARAALGGNG